MAVLTSDFREREARLTEEWYEKLVSMSTRKVTIIGVTKPNSYPRFIKRVTRIISAEVRVYSCFSSSEYSVFGIYHNIMFTIIVFVFLTVYRVSTGKTPQKHR